MNCAECGRALGFGEATNLGGLCIDCDTSPDDSRALAVLALFMAAILVAVCWSILA